MRGGLLYSSSLSCSSSLCLSLPLSFSFYFSLYIYFSFSFPQLSWLWFRIRRALRGQTFPSMHTTLRNSSHTHTHTHDLRILHMSQADKHASPKKTCYSVTLTQRQKYFHAIFRGSVLAEMNEMRRKGRKGFSSLEEISFANMPLGERGGISSWKKLSVLEMKFAL